MKSFESVFSVKLLVLSAVFAASFSPFVFCLDGDAKEVKIELANKVNEKSKELNDKNKEVQAPEATDELVDLEEKKEDGMISAYLIAPAVLVGGLFATYTGISWLYNCNGVLPFAAGIATGAIAKTAYDAYIKDEIDFN